MSAPSLPADDRPTVVGAPDQDSALAAARAFARQTGTRWRVVRVVGRGGGWEVRNTGEPIRVQVKRSAGNPWVIPPGGLSGA